MSGILRTGPPATNRRGPTPDREFINELFNWSSFGGKSLSKGRIDDIRRCQSLFFRESNSFHFSCRNRELRFILQSGES